MVVFGENEGATVIAHNFKGYDSLPILEYLYQNGVKPTIIANGAKNMYIEAGKHQFVLPTCLADTVFIDALIHAF
jgi:hypothetical protein